MLYHILYLFVIKVSQLSNRSLQERFMLQCIGLVYLLLHPIFSLGNKILTPCITFKELFPFVINYIKSIFTP